MRHYLQFRRLYLLHQISHHHHHHHHHHHRRSIHTSPRTHHPNTATDTPPKNKSLLFFVHSTIPNPPPGPAPHTLSLATPPSPSQSTLPQSPLTDPNLTTARLRYKTPKPSPDQTAQSSEFQLALRQNPYAHALASSSVRQCQLTGARLPGEFLVGFGLARHPVTGGLWHLPREAAARREGGGRDDADDAGLQVKSDGDGHVAGGDEGAGLAGVGAVEADDENGAGAIAAAGADNDSNSGSEAEAREKTPHQRPGGAARSLSSTYFLCSAQGMSNIGKKYQFMGKKRKDYLTLMTRRWKDDPVIDVREVVWREDMEEFVKGLLRRKVVDGLEALVQQRRGKRGRGVVMCKGGWAGVEKIENVGGVLWFGGGGGGGGQVEEEIRPEELEGDVGKAGGEEAVRNAADELTARQDRTEFMIADGPPPYAMWRLSSREVPVYNLQRLLGEEHVRALREAEPGRYGGELTAIQTKEATRKVQQDLWRLMGYLSNKREWVG